MNDADPELIDHYWSRVELLAIEAESGEFISSELKQIIADAVEAFANEGRLESHLQTFISDLFNARDAYREQRPAYASVFARAALLASNNANEVA
jgi:hypothetical protein